MRLNLTLLIAAVVSLSIAISPELRGCPFCTAQSQTLSEEMRAADAVVLARLVKSGTEPDPRPDDAPGYGLADPDTALATFRIEKILRGEDRLIGVEEVEAVYFGKRDTDALFLITGIGEDRPDWTTPLPLSELALDYVQKLDGLPEKGADRLVFFQDFLRCDDPMLMQDAYDEFARAPYADVLDLKDHMKHDQLVEWIRDVELSPSRRRLFFTMLGVCGTRDDVPLLEHFLRPALEPLQLMMVMAGVSSLQVHQGLVVPPLVSMTENYERLKQQGMDALIACYLNLKGADGLPLIEELFLRDPDGDYKNAYSAIMALRFHGEETDVLPRERLLETIRLVLDNPTFADQVILDLSRWEDWSVLDRLVGMFKTSKENDYARQPIVQYLLVAAEQGGELAERATAAIQELESVDPDTVSRAEPDGVHDGGTAEEEGGRSAAGGSEFSVCSRGRPRSGGRGDHCRCCHGSQRNIQRCHHSRAVGRPGDPGCRD